MGRGTQFKMSSLKRGQNGRSHQSSLWGRIWCLPHLTLVISLALLLGGCGSEQPYDDAVGLPGQKEGPTPTFNEITFHGIDSVSDVTTSTVTLHWTHVSPTVAYRIFNSTSGSLVFVASVSAPSSSYNVTGLSPNTIYRFRVKAQNASGLLDTNTKDFEFSTSALPTAPSGLSLLSPASSPAFDNTPTIRVGGVKSGDVVGLFTDANCTNSVGSATASGATVDITSSALTAGSYTFYANVTQAETSECSTASVSYVLTVCPIGFVSVPGDATLGTSDFCVMQFEAKAWNDLNANQIVDVGEVEADGCFASPSSCHSGNYAVSRKPVSVADNLPWVKLNQSQARDACGDLNSVGESKYRLISNPEWMTIARNIESRNANWSGGAVGQGTIFQGNINVNVPSISGYNGSNPEAGSGRNNKAMHVLSNGEQIWDVVGNVAEWVDWKVTPSQKAYSSADGAPVSAWREFKILDTLISLSNEMFPNSWRASGTSYDSSKGVGQYYAGSNTSGGAAYRGGSFYDSLAQAGIFYLNLANGEPHVSDGLGFRCVYRP